MKKYVIIGIIVLLIGTLVYYRKNVSWKLSKAKHSITKIMNKMTKKYQWLILTTGDEGYTTEIVDGAFIYDNGDEVYIPSMQSLKSTLFHDSGTDIVGEWERPIPVKMEITWFSYAENKFYSGSFDLDVPRITKLFQEGYLDKFGDTSYYDFKIAVLPAGQVLLYLSGANTILVGEYQAKEYIVEGDEAFHRIMEVPEISIVRDWSRETTAQQYQNSMPQQTQEEIRNNKLSTHIWREVIIKYPWRFTIHIADKDDYPLKMISRPYDAGKYLLFIDGEKNKHFDLDFLTGFAPKPIPVEIDAVYDGQGGEYVIRIYPGNVGGEEFIALPYEQYRKREQQLVKLFKEFYERIGKQPFDLHLEIDKKFENPKLYLKKDDIMQEIPNVEFELFNSTFNIQLYPKE